MRPEAKERARAYLVKSAPRSIAGQGGDKTAYAVACTLAVDFGLEDGDVAELLAAYNVTKCDPRWSERDLERFVRSARRCAASKPGEVGKLLNQDAKNYTGPRSPANVPSAAGATQKGTPSPANKSATTGQPRAGASARTARTPFFEVRRAGEGAERRPARTLRTALFLSDPYKKKEETVNVGGSELEPSAVSVKKALSVPSEPSGNGREASDGRFVPSEVSGNSVNVMATRAKASEPSADNGERRDVTMVWNDTGEVWRNGVFLPGFNANETRGTKHG